MRAAGALVCPSLDFARSDIYVTHEDVHHAQIVVCEHE